MIRRVLCIMSAAMLSATTLMAQRPNTRDGFWIGFGLGTGSAGVECNVCNEDDRTSGPSGYFRAGGTVSSHVQMGGELTGWRYSTGWSYSSNGFDVSLGFASFIASVYPSARGAFFLKFGLGVMTYKLDDGFDELTATAPSVSLGLGYDFRLTDNFALTPYLNALGTSAVSFRINGGAAPTSQDIRINLWQIGLGFHWF